MNSNQPIIKVTSQDQREWKNTTPWLVFYFLLFFFYIHIFDSCETGVGGVRKGAGLPLMHPCLWIPRCLLYFSLSPSLIIYAFSKSPPPFSCRQNVILLIAPSASLSGLLLDSLRTPAHIYLIRNTTNFACLKSHTLRLDSVMMTKILRKTEKRKIFPKPSTYLFVSTSCFNYHLLSR